MKASGNRVLTIAVVVGALALPATVFAASVIISEIAWMGSAVSANHEWIELYNSAAEPVNLTGWTLVASDGTPNISLQGSVAAGGFFLLERTSDDTAPGIAADQIYTGALGNTGETLALKQSGGETAETVVGGADWANIGGNNATKETAQRAGSGWVTATGTPRAATALFAFSSGSTGDVGGAVSSGASSGPSSTLSVSPASPTSGSGSVPAASASFIRVRATVLTRGIAGADVLFSGEAEGFKGEPLQNARFRWSFGDGGSAEGKKVFYGYHYPGAYAVFLDVSSGEASATARGDITIVPAQLRVSRLVSGDAGFIEIANDGTEEIDLSFWHLRSSGGFFTIPANTVILSKRVVPFPSAITKLSADAADTALLYPNGSEAARYAFVAEPELRAVAPPTNNAVTGTAANSATAPAPLLPFPPALKEVASAESSVPDTPALSGETQFAAAATAEGDSGSRWLLGVAALSLVAVGGYLALLLQKRAPDAAAALRKEAEEFDLVE